MVLFWFFKNNWLNQRNHQRTFRFPHPGGGDDGVMVEAPFDLIRKLYADESGKLSKLAPSLSYAAVYPTNFQRQRVHLVLAVFNEKTLAALETLGGQSGYEKCGSDVLLLYPPFFDGSLF